MLGPTPIKALRLDTAKTTLYHEMGFGARIAENVFFGCIHPNPSPTLALTLPWLALALALASPGWQHSWPGLA